MNSSNEAIDAQWGKGWAFWREIREHRPGVAGAHLALNDVVGVLEAFIEQVEQQLTIEGDQPNEEQYYFGEEDLVERNERHDLVIDDARDHVRAAIQQLESAAEIIVERWST